MFPMPEREEILVVVVVHRGEVQAKRQSCLVARCDCPVGACAPFRVPVVGHVLAAQDSTAEDHVLTRAGVIVAKLYRDRVGDDASPYGGRAGVAHGGIRQHAVFDAVPHGHKTDGPIGSAEVAAH